MPKRPCNKLFQETVPRRRRRFVIYSSDSDSEPEIENNEEIEPPINSESMDTNHEDTQTGNLAPTQLSTETTIELDEDMRLALGDPAEDIPVFGDKIPEYIAERWNPILRKGLSKDLKEKLLKEHSVPDNCRLLKAPCLNPEIGSAVADVVRTRDKKIELRQNQLGHGITAISKAMAMIIDKKEGNKPETIKLLSEGCRILSDLHFVETQVRSKLITPCLDKSFLTIINDEVRDETLFGNKLPEKIKAAKSIEKQGSQIKKTAPVSSKIVPQQQNTTRSRQGNWNPPPRYPSSVNRGGRGGAYTSRSTQNTSYRRFQASSSASTQSQTATPAPPPPPSRQQTASRSRVPARQ